MKKCAYRFCKHKDKEIDGNNYIENNGKIYHKDCLREQTNIKKIVDVFYKYVDPNVSFPVLQRVIREIIDKKNCPADKLLFGLRFYISNKIPLHYPQGLFYVIANKQMNEAYKDHKERKVTQQAIVKEDSGESFNFKRTKPISFEDILK